MLPSVARHQHHIGRLHRDVGAGTDRQADIGLGQRRCIVDAVADEGDVPMRGLEPAHRFDLAFRQHLGHHLINAQLARDRLRGAGVVAGDHRHLQAQLVQRRDCGRRARLDRVGYRDDRGQAAVDSGIQRRLALRAEFRRQRRERGDVHAKIAHEAISTDLDPGSIDTGAHAHAGDRFEVEHGRQRDALPGRRINNGTGNRMLRM
ncbi:hypothetical protein G6F65_018063 [Rhizopus arrhizus]|nr:hypothetical protein G6F65_018063 [Rhizopus arrhizus]